MTAAAKLGVFVLALVAVFGAGYGIGTAVGPLAGAGGQQVEERHAVPHMKDTR